METSSQSGDTEIAEELLRFFVEKKEKECFAAMLYTCYELIKPDVAMEVGRPVQHRRLSVPSSSYCNPPGLTTQTHQQCLKALCACWVLTAVVVLQLAWLNGLTEFIMPYMIQTMKELTGKV